MKNPTHCLIGLLCCSLITSLPALETKAGDKPVVTSLSSYDYLTDDEMAGVEDAAAEETAVIGMDCPSRSSCACNCNRRCTACDSDAPWTLPQPCLLQNMGVKVGGWLEQGITLNPYNSNDGFNGPVATNDWDDQYQMNQLWVYFDRPADTGGCGTAIGGHVDLIYGSDWRFGVNEGLETEINGFDYQRYGLVIPQAYVEFAVNDLSVKLGHFAAILDYEAVPAVRNPFYSHSYAYGYTVPQLVTGLLGQYKLTDQWTLLAGFHRGWSMFEDTNDALDFMGGVKWVSESKKTSVDYAVSVGPQDPPADFNQIPGDQRRFVYSLVIQQQLTERLRYVAVQNLGTEENAPTPGNTAEWYGLNQYLLYTINPCWNANLRAEWLRDDDGVRIAGPGNIPGIYAWSGRGYAGNFYEVTAGLNWRPNGNWIVRPECRYDWYSGPAGPVGMPFDGGDESDQLTFGVDAILLF
jgi:hypothetical protein